MGRRIRRLSPEAAFAVPKRETNSHLVCSACPVYDRAVGVCGPRASRRAPAAHACRYGEILITAKNLKLKRKENHADR